MRDIVIALTVAVATICSVCDAAAQRNEVQLSDIPITSLAVRLSDEDASFEVIDKRMDETATAAVMFGLIGAAVSSAHTAAQDEETAEPLVATAESIDLDGIISQAITERLQARNTVPLAASADEASNILLVEIGEWGLVRRAQLPDLNMRAFIKLNISVLDARGRRLFGPQRVHSIGQRTGPMADFTPETFQAEIETLAARAGQQVANTIIYR